MSIVNRKIARELGREDGRNGVYRPVVDSCRLAYDEGHAETATPKAEAARKAAR